jgi:hypothetical protein
MSEFSVTPQMTLPYTFNPFKAHGNYMYQLLQQSVRVKFCLFLYDSQCKQRLFP